MENYLELNRKMWNDRVEPHLKSALYDMDAFLKGQSSLNEIELPLLGDVRGKSILHLQCHFGQDSLSLARMGAKVTGVDFSEKAIETARQINEDLGLDAKFICSDVLALDGVLEEQFDVVFTSYGTVTWLPELGKWGEIVSNALNPGGHFVMAEFHPVVWMFDDDFKDIFYSYFNKKPIVEETEGSYADKNSEMKHTFVGWNHALEEVVMALIEAGLSMRHLGEYDYSPYDIFPGMVASKKGYTFENRYEKLPLIYSLVFNKA